MRLALGAALVVALMHVVASTSTDRAIAAVTAPRNAEPAPVASLEPAKTEALGRRLVASGPARTAQTPTTCRPLRAVFYAATDYLRLATKLAATPSPCAEYYVSIPPLVADKTRPRPNAAGRVRALGPNFHALAEIHFATWTRWVQSTGSTWYQAGVTARERMAEAGYDVTRGDSWVVNELSSAVRRGTGSARANIRELLRGLYEGGGRQARGAVFVIGVGQRTTDTSLLQTNLQNWYSDSAFWADMATYVSDWSQEVYGDIRSHAVPGAPEQTRRDYLNDYLQHPLVLAGVGPPSIEPARAYLRSTYAPLANAAWERESGYGWTMVPAEQMAAYVSSQVHALRYFSATSGQPRDHWGFAWAPRNAAGVPAGEFTAKSNLFLERLAAAIRDSAETPDPADPGSAACGPPGQNLSCAFDVEGARFNEAWKSFRTWTQPVLTFATAPQTIAAGTPSAGMSMRLVTTSGLPITTPSNLSVTLSSSSATGTFSTSSAGPWTRTLSLSIAPGTGTSGLFYYLDTRVGAHTLSASAVGASTGTQTLTVTAGALAAVTVTPRAATISARAARELSATGRDAFGNVFPVIATWSVTPRSLGTLAATTGSTTTFTARRVLGQATVRASVTTSTGAVAATASLRVTPGRLRVSAITYRVRKRTVFVSLRARDAAGAFVSQANIAVTVLRNGRRYVVDRARTGPAGRVELAIPAPRRGGCLTTKLRRVTAAGFVWDGRTPRNRRCFKS